MLGEGANMRKTMRTLGALLAGVVALGSRPAMLSLRIG
jgi:hypothetical protein